MSSAQQTLSHMRALKLPAMVETYQLQLGQPQLQEIPFDERLGILFDSEVSARANNRIKRLIKTACFPEFAVLEEMDWRAGRGLEKSSIARLASCEWVNQHQNILIVGATGVGKSWLACAFGVQACRLGSGVLYRRSVDLYAQIATALADGSLRRLKARLSRVNVLVLDDIGLGELTSPIANVLWDIIDTRCRSGSLIITSQFPIDDWHRFIPDPTLADAIMDRIIHQSHKIQLKGESMRKIYAKKQLEATKPIHEI